MKKKKENLLVDPTANFCKALLKSTRERGNKIANEYFNGKMAAVMGEVFGDMLACGVMNTIGNSLFDVPMQ